MNKKVPLLNFPPSVSLYNEAHQKWLLILQDAEALVQGDDNLQQKAAQGLTLKTRNLPIEVLSRMYVQYCNLINKLYDAYLINMQLQRAPYIKDIVSIFVKRIFELRNELVHLIVNDYIYVDGALEHLKMIPQEVEILVPYHFPVECRKQEMEDLYKTMLDESIKRKIRKAKRKQAKLAAQMKKRERERTPAPAAEDQDDEETVQPEPEVEEEEEKKEETVEEGSDTLITEDYINARLIQRHERYRQFFIEDCKAKCAEHKRYYGKTGQKAPRRIRKRACLFIQTMYREFMRLKREKARNIKRDILLGILPDVEIRPCKDSKTKMYEHRREKRESIKQGPYAMDVERQMAKILFITKEGLIEDITDEIMEWFKEWYYDYGFFPQYPYVDEGGTVLVVTGQYPTIEEQVEDDERYEKFTKGKTKDQIKKEKQQEKFDAKVRAELAKETEKKLAEALFKARCNPLTDPGYTVKISEVTGDIITTLRKYYQAWSLYDQFPMDECKAVIYGYMMPMIDEEIMYDMNLECRQAVDELMRLELKVFVKAQKAMFHRVGWRYPKLRIRKRPKPPTIPKPFVVDQKLLDTVEKVFDLGIMSRPTVKFDDIVGDMSYANYEYNIADPMATYPPPGYGDVKRRLVLSCVFGSGIEPSAKRNKAVMLLGIPRNGKSFLVDTVAGELNAIKFNISPEVLSAATKKPGRVVNSVFQAARVFQPSVIFLKNIEKVFAKKVLPAEKKLQAKSLKAPLKKALKVLPAAEKVIFIATCSEPYLAAAGAMIKQFNEVVLVPRPDYGSMQQYLMKALLPIHSVPLDYCFQSMAWSLQGYGFGFVMEMVKTIMTAERICKLNITHLSPMEFLEYLLEHDLERMSTPDYEKNYVDFFIKYSFLRKEREEYAIINQTRKYVYEKLAQIEADKEAKEDKARDKANDEEDLFED